MIVSSSFFQDQSNMPRQSFFPTHPLSDTWWEDFLIHSRVHYHAHPWCEIDMCTDGVVLQQSCPNLELCKDKRVSPFSPFHRPTPTRRLDTTPNPPTFAPPSPLPTTEIGRLPCLPVTSPPNSYPRKTLSQLLDVFNARFSLAVNQTPTVNWLPLRSPLEYWSISVHARCLFFNP